MIGSDGCNDILITKTREGCGMGTEAGRYRTKVGPSSCVNSQNIIYYFCIFLSFY